MPLKKGSSKETIQQNIEALLKEGKPKDQAAAIAYSYAQDSKSARIYDDYGWFEVMGNPISKEGVFPYSGAQIPNAPDKSKIYMAYRPADELSSDETIESFRLLPFINEHLMLGEPWGNAAEEKGIQGVTGEDVYFESPYLKANLKVFSKSLQESLDAGKVELSPGYICLEWDWTPGEFNGQKYDVVQRKLRGNHLALVEEGRTGPDVAVMDSNESVANFNNKEVDEMDLQELIAAVQALAAKVDAIGSVVEKLKPLEEKEHGVSLDEESEATPVADEEPPVAAAPVEDAPEDDVAALKDKVAALEAKLQTMQNAAMDSGKVFAEIGKRNELADKLSYFVGSFVCDSMSLQGVAEYGVNKLGLSCAKGQELTAVESYLHGRDIPAKQPVNVFAVQDGADKKVSAIDSYISGEGE